MYERIIREAMQTPWALTPRYCAIVQDILRFRASGGQLTAADLQARIGGSDTGRAAARGSGVIAVVPVHGVIAHRNFEASSGMTSTEVIGDMIDTAVANDTVTALVADFCTPGGTVPGVPELAARIAEAAKTKWITAFVNAECCSAGFWLASQCSEIVSTPSGYCGSIGVYALYEDWSAYLDKEGIKINAISAGEHKLEGAFWEEMSEETRAFIQADVDRVHVDFLSAVAKGRETTVADVKKNYGGGRVFGAKEALGLGMIDRIETFDKMIARLSKMKPLTKPASAAVASAMRSAASDARQGCNGSGLKPETYMGDPAGQEPCAECGGTGKRQSAATTMAAADQAAADAEALARALTEF